MLEISNILKELIIKEGCIIIPGLGALVSNYKSASIDDNNNLLSPPKRMVTFNSKLKSNDGVLANYIINKFSLSRIKADEVIDDFVNTLRKEVENSGKFQILNIGTFVKDSKGEIQFEPDMESNLWIDSYGLDNIKVNPLKKTEIEKEPVPVKENIQKAPKRKRRLWPVYLLFLVVIGAAVINFVAPQFYDNLKALVLPQEDNKPIVINPDSEELKNIPEEEINAEDTVLHIEEESNPVDSSVVKDQNQTAIDAEVKKVAEADTPKNVAEKIEAKTDKKSALFYNEDNADYYLVAGSFAKRENAEKLQQTISEKGHKTEILHDSGKFRVVFGKYKKKAEANKALDDLKKKYTETSVWLLTIKRK